MTLRRKYTSMLFSIALGTSISAAPPAVTPRFIPANPEWEGKLWIPLDALVDGKGGLRPEASPPEIAPRLSPMIFDLRDAERRRLFTRAGTAPEQCPVSVSSSWGRHEARRSSTVDQLAKESHAIVTGKVVSSTPGVVLGNLGSLLEVSVVDVLKGAYPTDRIFVFYPFVFRQIDQTVICRSDLRYPARPAVSDEVLVFLAVPALDAKGALFAPEPEELIFADGQGVLRAQAPPAGEGPDGGSGLAAVRRSVKDAVGRERSAAGGKELR